MATIGRFTEQGIISRQGVFTSQAVYDATYNVQKKVEPVVEPVATALDFIKLINGKLVFNKDVIVSGNIKTKLSINTITGNLKDTVLETPNIINLTVAGETPSTSTIYNAGTLIINTVDNKAWVGTGNASTEGSFISISPSAADNADIDGGEFSLDGGTY